MDSDLRKTLAGDIENLRKKADYYKGHHLFEAAHFANALAGNLELALTTLPDDDTSPIA